MGDCTYIAADFDHDKKAVDVSTAFLCFIKICLLLKNKI